MPDGRKYVGCTTKTAAKRLQQHKKDSKARNVPLRIALQDHHLECSIEVLFESDDPEELKAAEVHHISSIGTMWPEGLNATAGGNGVVAPWQEASTKRIAAFKRTISQDPTYADRQRIAQLALWAEEKRAARAAATKALWSDPEYVAKQKSARSGRAIKEKPPKLTKWQRSELRKAMWSDPAYRAKVNAAREAATKTDEFRAKASANQKRLMSDPAERARIAHSMSKHKGCRFTKTGIVSKRDGKINRTLPLLGESFCAMDAILLGWGGREFDECLKRGIINEAD